MRFEGSAISSRPSNVIEPVRRADDAHDRFERRRLAGAVAAEQGHDLARVNLEVDAVQDVRFAVPGVQVLDAEQGRLRARLQAWPAPI